MAAIFAVVAAYSDSVSYGFKAGLAATILVDSVGALLVLYVYTKYDFVNSAIDLFLAASFFGIALISLFQFLGQDIYSAIAIIAVIRCAYDVYVYVSAPREEIHLHAKKYFITFLQATIPLFFVIAFGLIAREAGYTIKRDEHFFTCESALCHATSPPDAYIIFGMFMYPLMAWLAIHWRPSWMRWIPAPKRITN